MGHWPSRARDLHPLGSELLAGLVDIWHPDREVTKGGTKGIGLLLVPVVVSSMTVLSASSP